MTRDTNPMAVALIGMVVDIGSRFDFHGVRLAWLETFLDLMLRYRDKSQYRVSPTKARTMITWNKFSHLRLDMKHEFQLQFVNMLRRNMIVWPVTPLQWLMISLIWWIALYPDIQVIFWEKPLFTLTVERCLGQAPMDNLYQSMPDKPIPATSSPIDRFLLQCPKTTSSLKT